jgi:hypothetical protein
MQIKLPPGLHFHNITNIFKNNALQKKERLEIKYQATYILIIFKHDSKSLNKII